MIQRQKPRYNEKKNSKEHESIVKFKSQSKEEAFIPEVQITYYFTSVFNNNIYRHYIHKKGRNSSTVFRIGDIVITSDTISSSTSIRRNEVWKVRTGNFGLKLTHLVGVYCYCMLILSSSLARSLSCSPFKHSILSRHSSTSFIPLSFSFVGKRSNRSLSSGRQNFRYTTTTSTTSRKDLNKLSITTASTGKLKMVNDITTENMDGTFQNHIINTKTEVNTESQTHKRRAKIIPSSSDSLKLAGKRIQSGELVSFPTETVYGLGANALDPIAVTKVFEAKERPLTDPLIAHVLNIDEAMELWDLNYDNDEQNHNNTFSTEDLKKALMALTDQFWPGPLTIVSKAKMPPVPPLITAHTGQVACRSPSHPIARELIRYAGVPIAAPSANKFGHVSPTRASHVMDDLGDENVWIVDSDNIMDADTNAMSNHNQDASTSSHCCEVGVESTVARVSIHNMHMGSKGTITILRHGAISASDIKSCLTNANMSNKFEVYDNVRSTGTDVAHVAPGQTIKHYSPSIVSYIISRQRLDKITEETLNPWNDEEKELLQKAVVIDFNGLMSSASTLALAYQDLSVTGSSAEAASNVFQTLRWSETVDGAERVYFPQIKIYSEDNHESNQDNSEIQHDDALILALKDRLTRAASGIVIETLV